MLGGKRRRGMTAGVSWILDRVFRAHIHTLVLVLCLLSPPTQSLCYAWHHHFTSSVSCLLIKHPTHSTSVVVTSRPIQHNHFTPPTEHQSASFPMSWSSLFSSQTFLRTPPHLQSFILVNGLSRGWESSNAYDEKACAADDGEISLLYFLWDGRWTADLDYFNALYRQAITLVFTFKTSQPLIHAWQIFVKLLTLNCFNK